MAPAPYDGKQYSPRASILLWICLAAAFWTGLGALVGALTGWP